MMTCQGNGYGTQSISMVCNRGPPLDAQGGLDHIHSVMTKVVKEEMEDAY